MKRIITIFLLVFSILLITPVVLPQTMEAVKADSQNQLTEESVSIAVNGRTTLSLKKRNPKAEYIYTSDAMEVATVSLDGVVTGKKAGKAQITVNQKLNGKTTTAGTCLVNVKEAKIIDSIKSGENMWCYTTQTGYYLKNPDKIEPSKCMLYVNKLANYHFYSNNSNLVISDSGIVTEVKKSGNAQIMVKEVYEGKTRVVGKFPVKLGNPTYIGEKKQEIYLGGQIYGDDFYYLYDGLKYVEKFNISWYDHKPTKKERAKIVKGKESNSWGDKVITLEKADGSWNGIIKAKGVGKRYCLLRQYNYLNNTYDKVFGEFIINVPNPVKVTKLIFPWEDPMNGDVYNFKKGVLNIDSKKEVNLSLYIRPLYYKGKIKAVTSRPDIAQVKMDSTMDYVDSQDLIIKCKKPGKFTITLKNGKYSRKLKVQAY